MQVLLQIAGEAGQGLEAAVLESVIVTALAFLGFHLWRLTAKRHLLIWSVAWALYAVRVLAIISFIRSEDRIWLYWHQVLTGWCGVATLWATLVFTRDLRWRWWTTALVIFLPAWSAIAIYQVEVFLLAALPMVLFLAGATVWAAVAVLRYASAVGSSGAKLLGWALAVQAVHHLDYPWLRARGAWDPWGYYLDIIVALGLGAGILMLVTDDLRRGVDALSALSQELQKKGRGPDVLAALLDRPLTLPGVSGSALYTVQDGRIVRGAGACEAWTDTRPEGFAARTLRNAVTAGQPLVTPDWPDPDRARPFPYAAVLPIFRELTPTGALILVGDARDPFTALDDRFLVALGSQVGAALENADLWSRLEVRTVELERLSARMVAQHEEERRRLSRELHDETAQVFSAVKMQLGSLRPALPEPQVQRLDRALALVDEGIRSIRSVTNDLRPSLLDDLGLMPALRSLVTEFTERTDVGITLAAPDALPTISNDAELALFRALQEGLSNILRHAQARQVQVTIRTEGDAIQLLVEDDGRGLDAIAELDQLERAGHMGLVGMRERLAVLGGTVSLMPRTEAGARLDIRLPVVPEPVA